MMDGIFADNIHQLFARASSLLTQRCFCLYTQWQKTPDTTEPAFNPWTVKQVTPHSPETPDTSLYLLLLNSALELTAPGWRRPVNSRVFLSASAAHRRLDAGHLCAFSHSLWLLELARTHNLSHTPSPCSACLRAEDFPVDSHRHGNPHFSTTFKSHHPPSSSWTVSFYGHLLLTLLWWGDIFAGGVRG